MSTILRDLQHGFRTLLRHPLFALVAVCTLALGIGANTAVFSVIDAVLLRPLPYPHSEELAAVRTRFGVYDSASVSYPDYLDWRAAQHCFSDLAIARRDSFNLSYGKSGTVPPERISGQVVTANYLSIVGLTLRYGRDFTEEEDTPGGPRAVILTDDLWHRRFGGDAAVVGRRLILNGVSREIVGILPPSASFRNAAELYVPLGELRADKGLLDRGSHAGFTGIGRLKPGITPALAAANLDNIERELERRYPLTNSGQRTSVEYLLESNVGKYRHGLFTLLAAVACVLLIACANVANLQLARATAREKELAVRAALGASRARLMRQMLTESALLGLLGGALGILLALWAVDLIISLSPPDAKRFQDTHLDPRALGFTSLAALGAGVLAGVWPAWRVSGTTAMAAALREGNGRSGTGGANQHRARSLLVVLQVALAVVLLTGAGLTLQSFWRSQNEPVGFNAKGVFLASISLPDVRYGTDEKQALFYTALTEKLRAIPGVEYASVGVNLPFDNSDWTTSFHVTGTPKNPPGQDPPVEINYVTPDYFAALGIPLLAGRVFSAQDRIGQEEVVVIDEEFARRHFPGQDPIGQHLDPDPTTPTDPVKTIVGVVGRTRNDAPNESPANDHMVQMHSPMLQHPSGGGTIVIRVKAGDPARLAEPVRRAVLSLDDDLPISEVTTMARNVAASLAPQRMTMALLGVFAALALALASIGLYGVMALSVTQRTRELGIRLALGAQRLAVVGLIMRQGAQLVGVGLIVGLAGALGMSRILATLLYGVGGSDLFILSGVTVVLATASLVACWLPARRATRVDPMDALRRE